MANYSRDELNAMSRSELKKVYKSARRNLMRNIRSMEKEGAQFDINMRPDIPKKITPGSVMKLQQLNNVDYRASHATVIDPETGKERTWKQYQKDKRSASARKGARTRKRIKEVTLNIKYIEIVDGYMEDAVNKAGSGLHKIEQREEALIDILGPYQSWKLLMAEAYQSEESTKMLNKALVAMERSIKECVDDIINASDAGVVYTQTWKLGNAIRGLIGKYSAMSSDQAQNIRGGGWFD